MFNETRKSLEKMGLPKGDLYELTTSGKTFPDGAHFRMEVPTVNSIEAFQALIERADELGIVINRIDETYGIFRHTLEELRAYTKLAKERGVALNLSVGPRATYDTGATVQTPQGVRIGYRLRGMEQVVRAIEDVKRAVSAGCRGILVYDEGLLWTLNELRKAGICRRIFNLSCRLTADTVIQHPSKSSRAWGPIRSTLFAISSCQCWLRCDAL